jgi:hypothetical protein
MPCLSFRESRKWRKFTPLYSGQENISSIAFSTSALIEFAGLRPMFLWSIAPAPSSFTFAILVMVSVGVGFV